MQRQPLSCRLVAKLHPFPGMRHLDVAGGTGDIARRVRNAIDRACEDSAKHAHDDVLQVCSKAEPSSAKQATMDCTSRTH